MLQQSSFLQVNISNIIYLNCEKRYEDIDDQLYTQLIISSYEMKARKNSELFQALISQLLKLCIHTIMYSNLFSFCCKKNKDTVLIIQP